MEKIKKVMFNSKEYNIKYSLTTNEFMQCIATVLSSVFDDSDNSLPWFINKPLIINKSILLYYTDIDANIEDEELENIVNSFDDKGNGLKDIIYKNVYVSQYKDLIKAINEGIEYSIKLQLYQDSTENKMNYIMDKIIEFTDNFPAWAELVNGLLKTGDIDKLMGLLAPILVKLGMSDKK